MRLFALIFIFCFVSTSASAKTVVKLFLPLASDSKIDYLCVDKDGYHPKFKPAPVPVFGKGAKPEVFSLEMQHLIFGSTRLRTSSVKEQFKRASPSRNSAYGFIGSFSDAQKTFRDCRQYIEQVERKGSLIFDPNFQKIKNPACCKTNEFE